VRQLELLWGPGESLGWLGGCGCELVMELGGGGSIAARRRARETAGWLARARNRPMGLYRRRSRVLKQPEGREGTRMRAGVQDGGRWTAKAGSGAAWRGRGTLRAQAPRRLDASAASICVASGRAAWPGPGRLGTAGRGVVRFVFI
jgi:hypothetical protein